MTTRFLPAVFACALMLSACAADPELTALEEYLAEGEEVATAMSDAGIAFETLINVQGDMAAWTQAEKDELQKVLQQFEDLSDRAEAMTPPMILTNVHPILIEAINEMRMAVEGVATVAFDPSKATDALAEEIDQHGTRGEELGDEYLEKMEQAINDAYPELME